MPSRSTSREPTATASRQRPPRGHGAWLAGGLILALWSAWWVGQWREVQSEGEAGYWIGVAGGVAMLALFAYPLRKRARWLRGVGSTRHWFIAHMLLGIGGPWLILVHCQFRFGSLNATVALLSMLVVAASGIVGRFLYVRVHRGLNGERAELQSLQADLREDHASVGRHLAAVANARERLFDFETSTLARPPGLTPLHQLQLAWQAHRCLRGVFGDIHQALRRQSMDPASASSRHQLKQVWRGQAQSHVSQVLRVAQFAAWERLFALWHVLHVPFVYLMVVCALVHVAAVHAY